MLSFTHTSFIVLNFQEINTLANVINLSGPYVDEIRYDIINEESDAIQALIDGEIDLIGEYIDTTYYNQLNSTENVEVTESLENGYTFLSLNCDKYPLNISNFRRALAFAIDKNRIVNESYANLAQPLDVVVPLQNPFSIEKKLNTSYYNHDFISALELLESSGFNDTDEDGWLEGPGVLGAGTIELKNITIEGSSSNQNDILLDIVVENLADIGIQSNAILTSNAAELQYRTSNHIDYDIILLNQEFQDFKISWLGPEFGSEYVNSTGNNPANFRNSTLDSLIPDIMTSIDIEAIEFASQKMQSILVQECPYIPCYQKHQISAIRTNRFENYVNDILKGPRGWWTNYNIQLKESEGGPIGGTLVRSLASDIDSFNFMLSSSKTTLDILNNLYEALLIQTSEGEIRPWLAESFSIQHNDNVTRITFNLVKNATWSDSHPISAYDVAFSVNYLRDAGLYPLVFTDLFAAYAKNDYTFIVEYRGETYWHIYDYLHLRILPKHVFIHISNPSVWKPNLDNHCDPIYVTSGPFILSSYSRGNTIILKKNLKYYRLPASDEENIIRNKVSPKSNQRNDVALVSKRYCEASYSDVLAEITWTSNDKAYPQQVMNDSYLHGDHVTINATWSNTNITNATLEFYSYSKKSKNLIIPNSAYNPFKGVIDTTQFSWIYINNIKQGEQVDIIANFSNTDCDFMIWWAGTDNGTWAFTNNLLGSSMCTNKKPENGSFKADHDGDLAVGCFDYDQEPGTFTITAKSGIRYTIGPSTNNSVIIDTYDILNDGNWSLRFTGIDNNTTLVMIMDNVTILNSFKPVVEVLTPNGGTISGDYDITWNSTDVNVDDTVTHEVRVSNDGGISYMLLAASLNDSAYLWNQTGWIRLSTYVIKVVSSDGLLQGFDESDSNVTAGDPIVVDSNRPLVMGPNEIALEYKNENIFLSWFVSDFHACKYSLFLNGSLYETGFWSTGNLTIQFRNYTIGIFNFTLVVNDTSSNSDSLSTMLIIFNNTSTSSTTTTTTATTTSEVSSPTIISTTTTPVDGPFIVISFAIIICSAALIFILLIKYQKRTHLRTQ
jgi:ABC-type transport system substrate-binding protein